MKQLSKLSNIFRAPLFFVRSYRSACELLFRSYKLASTVAVQSLPSTYVYIYCMAYSFYPLLAVSYFSIGSLPAFVVTIPSIQVIGYSSRWRIQFIKSYSNAPRKVIATSPYHLIALHYYISCLQYPSTVYNTSLFFLYLAFVLQLNFSCVAHLYAFIFIQHLFPG